MYRRRNTVFSEEMHIFMLFGVCFLFYSEKWDMYNVSGQIERRATSNAVLEGRRNNEGGEGADCQMGTR
jgi:hypothetical protein